MNFWKSLFQPECEEIFHDSSRRYHWPFAGDLFELRMACRAFPAADEAYFDMVSTGGFAIHAGALRFFSICNDPLARNVLKWNENNLWKNAYGDIFTEPFWCFAEDVFGNQFCFKGMGVSWLNAETGTFVELAPTFSAWKERIAPELDYFTGAKVAMEWHESHGSHTPLTPDCILMPIRPFRCEGAFEAANLYPTPAPSGMAFRGKAAQKLKTVPDCADLLTVYRKEEEHLLSILRKRHLILQSGSRTGRQNLTEYIARSLEFKHRIFRLPAGIRSREEYLAAIFRSFPIQEEDGDDSYKAVIDIHLDWTAREEYCLIIWEEIDSLPPEELYPILDEYLTRLHHLTKTGKPDQFRLFATSSRNLTEYLAKAEIQGVIPEEDRELAERFLGFADCTD